MKTKNVVFLIVCTAFIMLTWGCLTTTKFKTEPKTPTDTLVIGRVLFIARNFESFHGVSVNGEHTEGVEIHFINQSTDKKHIIQAFGENGFFYTTKIEPGNYKIDRIYYKSTSEKARFSIWVPPSKDNFLRIVSGKVNNLGLIMAAFDGGANWGGYEANKGYPITEDLFREIYFESEWLNYDWIEVKLE